jgi:hypothetical protein
VQCRERKVPQVFDIGDPRLSKKEEYGRCLWEKQLVRKICWKALTKTNTDGRFSSGCVHWRIERREILKKDVNLQDLVECDSREA